MGKDKVTATRTVPNVTTETKRGERTMPVADLAHKLLYADTEDKVIEILKAEGYWDNPDMWRLYSDNENNFATIGNQQSSPDAALTEKIVNSIDAVLIEQCRLKGIEPESGKAPSDMKTAIEDFFGGNGNVSAWTKEKRLEVGQNIYLTTTGHTPREGQPCFTIVDKGEGLKPDRFHDTILSLNRSNKLRIPFVQGKFNMGGSGALKFCGKHNLQLIISRRNPDLLEKGARGRDRDWGITIVRREDPEGGRRSSMYTYLAPEGAEKNPRMGDVLTFRAATFGLFPDGEDPFGEEVTHGTAVKLYEYDTTARQQVPRQGSIMERVDLLLPKCAIPFRVYEGRNKYWQSKSARPGTLSKTVNGIQIRLMDDYKSDRRNNVEWLTTSEFKIDGQPLEAQIFVLKKGKAKSYRRSEGIVFTINGQTHGHLKDYFFRRKAVGMSYLVDSLMVFINCDGISGRHREDLFLNSRDRLADTAFRKKIEAELEEIIGGNDKLQQLREKRRRQHNRARLTGSAPMEQALKSLLEGSESLKRLFITGDGIHPEDAAVPEKEAEEIEIEPYEGKRHPSFFKFKGMEEGVSINRRLRQQSDTRATFETDVENDYFSRDEDPGELIVEMINLDQNGEKRPLENYTFTLEDGEGQLTIPTPSEVGVGEEIIFNIEVHDPERDEPWVNQINAEVIDPKQKEAKERDRIPEKPKDQAIEEKKDDKPVGFALPEIRRVEENPSDDDNWAWDEMEPAFDKYSALRIVHAGTEEGRDRFDFYVNTDNIHLNAEMAQNRDKQDIVRSKFVYGIVLLGLSVIRGETEIPISEEVRDAEEVISLEEKVEMFTRYAAAVLVPMIDNLSMIEDHDLFETL